MDFFSKTEKDLTHEYILRTIDEESLNLSSTKELFTKLDSIRNLIKNKKKPQDSSHILNLDIEDISKILINNLRISKISPDYPSHDVKQKDSVKSQSNQGNTENTYYVDKNMVENIRKNWKKLGTHEFKAHAKKQSFLEIIAQFDFKEYFGLYNIKDYFQNNVSEHQRKDNCLEKELFGKLSGVPPKAVSPVRKQKEFEKKGKFTRSNSADNLHRSNKKTLQIKTSEFDIEKKPKHETPKARLMPIRKKPSTHIHKHNVMTSLGNDIFESINEDIKKKESKKTVKTPEKKIESKKENTHKPEKIDLSKKIIKRPFEKEEKKAITHNKDLQQSKTSLFSLENNNHNFVNDMHKKLGMHMNKDHRFTYDREIDRKFLRQKRRKQMLASSEFALNTSDCIDTKNYSSQVEIDTKKNPNQNEVVSNSKIIEANRLQTISGYESLISNMYNMEKSRDIIKSTKKILSKNSIKHQQNDSDDEEYQKNPSNHHKNRFDSNF